MKKLYLHVTTLVSLVILVTSSSAIMAKGTADNPAVISIDQSGSSNNVDANITNDSSNPIPVTVQERAKVIVVGVTDEMSMGNVGLLNLNERCASKFSGGHWCTSREVLTGYQEEIIDAPEIFAWVQPSITGAFYEPGVGPQAVDASGLIRNPNTGMTCNGWTSTSNRGLAFQLPPFGGFSPLVCTNVLPAVCCASRAQD